MSKVIAKVKLKPIDKHIEVPPMDIGIRVIFLKCIEDTVKTWTDIDFHKVPDCSDPYRMDAVMYRDMLEGLIAGFMLPPDEGSVFKAGQLLSKWIKEKRDTPDMIESLQWAIEDAEEAIADAEEDTEED